MTPKRSRWRTRPALALGLALGCAAAPEVPLSSSSDGRYVMGTVLEVTAWGPDPHVLRAALDDVFAEAARLEGLLSVYRDTSDVSRLNRAAGAGPVSVDPLVVELLRRSVDYARLTRGSFDVTLGPLVRLWTRAAQREELPSEEDLARARERVGAGAIRLASGTAALPHAGMSIDLGGIAKGFALDRVRPLLQRRGIRRALLSFGQSSAWAVGAPPDGPGWRLLARAPDGGFAGVLTLHDQALSVSGSLGQWSEIAGRRYGHVLDPRTGWPLTRRQQAIVVASNATLAEALSKALLVLGPGEGTQLVERQAGCEGLLIDEDGRSWATPGFREAVRFEQIEAPKARGRGGRSVARGDRQSQLPHL